MAQIEAASGDSAGTTVNVGQEGAYVCLHMQDSPTPTRLDALLTPDQAEGLAFALSQSAQDARKFGAEEAT